MGKVRQIIWKERQKEALNTIYRLVLKHGWSIKLEEVTPEGTHIFELYEWNKPDVDLDLWYLNRSYVEQRRITLTWDPKHDPYTDDSGEWVVR